MQKSNAPTKLTVVFASGTGAGPVNTVPLTPGATTGTASYQTGFTSVNMEPIASGGVPPFGADFNGLFQAATKAQIYAQSGFMYSFDSTFASDASIGGYPSQSVLMMGSGKGFWINQADNNSQNPDATGSTNWLGLPAAGTYAVATTGGSTTPDPSLLGVTTLLVTGTLASNATLVLPLVAGMRWIIQNNTTGSFTLTVQGATGAGVSITQGSALTVFTDGTNYYAASANLSGAYLPIDGTAVAATKLATARNFSITGLATAGAVSFDGTGNVSLNVTALNVPSALGYTPANDASVVHISGSETITGAKTFSAASGTASNVNWDCGGLLRAGTFSSAPSSGKGIEFFYYTPGAACYISAYDRTAASALPLNIQASYITTNCAVTVGGQCSASSFQISSSRKLKTGLRPIRDAVELIEGMQGYRGRYKLRMDKSGKQRMFLVAEDFMDDIPELIGTREDGLPTVEYDGVVPILVEAVKTLLKRVRDLEDAR